MARLYRVDNGETIGQINDKQLQFLVDMLEEMGARGRPIVGGVFEAELDGPRARLTRVHTDAIESSIRAGYSIKANRLSSPFGTAD